MQQYLKLELPIGKRIYFASDFHLGTPSIAESQKRERKIAEWLESIAHDAMAIFLLGDQFDFWFEYKHVVPKGHALFLSKITELKQRGIAIYFFTGNHDMWMFDYFPEEYGIPVLRGNLTLEVENKRFLIGHGDGLGPGDHTYKFLKFFFNSRLCQRMFALLHPWVGFSIATRWSRSSRASNVKKDEKFMGESEYLWAYCNEVEQKTHHDYYIFGHRHLVLELQVASESFYFNLGEWVTGSTYAVFDGKKVLLKQA